MLRKLGSKLNNSLIKLGNKSYNKYRFGNKFAGKILSGLEKGSRKLDGALDFADSIGLNTSGVRNKKALADGYIAQGREYKKKGRNEIEKFKAGVENDGYQYLGQQGLKLYNRFN